VSFHSEALGVGHIFTATSSFNPGLKLLSPSLYRFWRVFQCSGVQFTITAVGVGHNEDTLSSMRGIEGASWNIERPAGVTFTFQVR